MTSLQFVLCFYLFVVILAYPPKLLPFNSYYDLTENNFFTLTCNLLSDGGQSTTFQWFSNGIQIENSSDFRIDSSSPKLSFLTIHNLQRQHAGTYECRVVNSFGEADVTRTKINVQGNVFEICPKCGAKAFF